MLEQILGQVVKAVAMRGIGNTINDLTGETARRQEAERQSSIRRYKERCQHNSSVRRRVFDMIVSSEMESLKQNKEASTFEDDVVRQFCEKKVRTNIDERLKQTRIMLRQFREMCQRMCDVETVKADLAFWNEGVEAHRAYCKDYLLAMSKEGLSDFDSMKLIVQAQKLGLDEEDTDRIAEIVDRYRISIEGVDAFGRKGTECSEDALKSVFYGRSMLELFAVVLKEWSEAGEVYFDTDEVEQEESDWIDDEALEAEECRADDSEAEDSRNAKIVLIDAGLNKLAVIKSVRAISGLGLQGAKDLVDNLPAVIPLNSERHIWISDAIEMLTRDGAKFEVK